MKKYLFFAIVIASLGILTNFNFVAHAESNYIALNFNAVPGNETAYHWNEAKVYKAQNRLELARQSYLMALASSKTNKILMQLRRELQIVELQIRTMR